MPPYIGDAVDVVLWAAKGLDFPDALHLTDASQNSISLEEVTAMTLLSLSPKTTFLLIPQGGLCDQFKYPIVVAAGGRGVVARGCHGVSGPGQALRAFTLAHPPECDHKLEPSIGMFSQQRQVLSSCAQA